MTKRSRVTSQGRSDPGLSKSSDSNPDLPANRRTVFISHANPEDNDFTLWLAAHLAAAGYEVWSDITKLIGGERFWRDVEAAIRDRCAKFIAVVSPAITRKRGFLKELSLADTVEGLGTLGDFIIPVRIALLPFADLPIELQGKNVIDAIGAWEQGLARLLKKLQEDNVPRRDDDAAVAVTQWAKDYFAFESRLQFENERVLSNWLPIPALPPALHVGRFTLTPDNVQALQEQFPCVQRHSRVVSFAPTMAFDLSSRYGLRAASDVATETFLEIGTGELVGLNYQDRANILTDLIHQAWIHFSRSRGLACFQLASGRDCWYWSAARTDLSRVRFTDALGVSGQRALWGQSRALGAHWHFALEAWPSVGRTNRFTLTPHVLFTTDGEALVGDSDRMHRLRRRFCKNWWQGRWRDLSSAFLTSVADKSRTMALPVAPGLVIAVGVDPRVFVAPVRADAESGADQTALDDLHDDPDLLYDDSTLDDEEDDEEDDEDGVAETETPR